MSLSYSGQAGLGLSHGMEWAGDIGGLVREGQGCSSYPGVRDPWDHEDTGHIGQSSFDPLIPVPIFKKIIF